MKTSNKAKAICAMAAELIFRASLGAPEDGATNVMLDDGDIIDAFRLAIESYGFNVEIKA